MFRYVVDMQCKLKLRVNASGEAFSTIYDFGKDFGGVTNAGVIRLKKTPEWYEISIKKPPEASQLMVRLRPAGKLAATIHNVELMFFPPEPSDMSMTRK